MPRGGARANAGRKKGIPDEIKMSVKGMASVHGKKAIDELARIAFKAEKDETRVAACKELLDRAYGKSTQSVDMTADIEATVEVSRIELVAPALMVDDHTAH